MLHADATSTRDSSERPRRPRLRATTSCTECRRRKQKCNKARDKPCNHCARRYPPVECTYETPSKQTKYTEIVVDLNSHSPKDPADGVEVRIRQKHASGIGPELAVASLACEQSEAFKTSSAPVDSNSGLLQRRTQYSLGEDEDVVEKPGNIIHRAQISQQGQRRSYASPMIKTEDLSSPFSPDYLTSYYGFANARVGDLAADSLRTLPIEPSGKNAQFLSLFIERLAPFMSSIDGKDAPTSFNSEWIPYMIQSPLVAYIGILTASYFDATTRGIRYEKSVDVISVKLKIIAGINEYLKNEITTISDEAITTVMSLAHNEWIYNEEDIALAHMKGLREMIRLRGGLNKIGSKTLKKLLTRTDYQIACTLERDLILDAGNQDPYWSQLDNYPVALDSPILPSKRNFVALSEELKISPKTAAILDDMRFLTTSAISFTDSKVTSQQITKFIATAGWIHKRLSSASPGDDYFYETCRIAAIVFSSSMLHRKPLSQSCTAELLGRFWMSMWRVPLSRWKKTPGIFLWFVLIMAPFAQGTSEGRFLKSMIGTAIMTVGLVDWEVTMKQLKTLVTLQKWLRDGRKSPLSSGAPSQILVKSNLRERTLRDDRELANKVL